MNAECVNVAIVLARCQKTPAEFGLRFEKNADTSYGDCALLLKPGTAKREGYGETRLTGSFEFANTYPGCPGCSNQSAFLCSCGKVGCWDGHLKTVTCPWCSQTVMLEGRITNLLAGQDR